MKRQLSPPIPYLASISEKEQPSARVAAIREALRQQNYWDEDNRVANLHADGFADRASNRGQSLGLSSDGDLRPHVLSGMSDLGAGNRVPWGVRALDPGSLAFPRLAELGLEDGSMKWRTKLAGRPNTRVQRTRSSPSAHRESLTRRALGTGR